MQAMSAHERSRKTDRRADPDAESARVREAELIRKKYQYRTLILRGELSLPHRTAARLIGPDCAYHLYSRKSSR